MSGLDDPHESAGSILKTERRDVATDHFDGEGHAIGTLTQSVALETTSAQIDRSLQFVRVATYLRDNDCPLATSDKRKLVMSPEDFVSAARKGKTDDTPVTYGNCTDSMQAMWTHCNMQVWTLRDVRAFFLWLDTSVFGGKIGDPLFTLMNKVIVKSKSARIVWMRPCPARKGRLLEPMDYLNLVKMSVNMMAGFNDEKTNYRLHVIASAPFCAPSDQLWRIKLPAEDEGTRLLLSAELHSLRYSVMTKAWMILNNQRRIKLNIDDCQLALGCIDTAWSAISGMRWSCEVPHPNTVLHAPQSAISGLPNMFMQMPASNKAGTSAQLPPTGPFPKQKGIKRNREGGYDLPTPAAKLGLADTFPKCRRSFLTWMKVTPMAQLSEQGTDLEEKEGIDRRMLKGKVDAAYCLDLLHTLGFSWV
eukprot:gene29589-5944_t